MSNQKRNSQPALHLHEDFFLYKDELITLRNAVISKIKEDFQIAVGKAHLKEFEALNVAVVENLGYSMDDFKYHAEQAITQQAFTNGQIASFVWPRLNVAFRAEGEVWEYAAYEIRPHTITVAEHVHSICESEETECIEGLTINQILSNIRHYTVRIEPLNYVVNRIPMDNAYASALNAVFKREIRTLFPWAFFSG